MNIGLEAFTATGCLAMSIVCHELGHYFALRERHDGATIEFHKGLIRTYIKGKYHEQKVGELPKDERNGILWAGIAAGTIPILAYGIFTQWWIMPIGVTLVYFTGTIPDIRLMAKRDNQ